MRKKVIIFLWSLLVFFWLALGCAFYAVWEGYIGYMPELQQLQNPVNKFASQIFSADGQLIGTWSYSEGNRIFVSYKDLPPALVNALVATEDERFFVHSGIDFKALLRAVVKRGILKQKSAGGGSTITQQLAKQLYSARARSTFERLLQKPIEWVIALKLERYYTKEEIITMYLNYFDFLHNAVGIKTAARTYFGKEPRDLTVDECAVLVGMCKNPSLFNPVRVPERCRERRNVVLDQMLKGGYITEAAHDSLQQKDLVLDFHRVDHRQGHGTYLREYLRRVLMAKRPSRSDYASWQAQKFFEDSLAWETDPLYGWCNKNVDANGKHFNIYTDGLKIYTTVDSRMQAYAEEAVQKHVVETLQPIFSREQTMLKNRPYANDVPAEQAQRDLQRAIRQSARWAVMHHAGYSEEDIERSFRTPTEMTVYTPHGEVDTLMSPLDSLKYYKGFLRAGFVCMETHTGHVKAYVGGTDYAHFQYDMAGQGRRQVGSTIKPYLYSLAMENGFSPCDVAPNVAHTYHVGDQTWTPRNSSKARIGEMVTLKWGLATSNNWISAWLLNQMSPSAFVRLIHEFGILNRDIVPSLSLCLGPCDISVIEMVGAYTAFPNRGVRRQPVFVTRIEDGSGNVVVNFSPRVHEVISEQAALKMIILMRGVIDGGTGGRMRFRYGIKAPMAGKTGTTNDNSDGWFVGYTPSLSFGAWVGGDERDIHFASMANGQGASSALPVVALFLQKVFADPNLPYKEDEQFNVPADFDPCVSVYEEDRGDGEETTEILE